MSYDNGSSWVQLGKATGEDGAQEPQGDAGQAGDSFFRSVTQDENYVYFTLADGMVITIPKGSSLSICFDAEDLIVIPANTTREIGYTVSSSLPMVQVEVIASADIKARVIPGEGLSGCIRLTTGAAIDEYSKVVVLVSNGEKVIMRTLTFEEEAIKVVNNANISVAAEGGSIELLYLSNVECEVIIPDTVDWLSLPQATRAMEQRSVTLLLETNEGATRTAKVTLQNKDASLRLEYTISQAPSGEFQLQRERELLIAIYNSLDGKNWMFNANWCSDRPVGEWEGITTGQGGFVQKIMLDDFSNIKGDFPTEICEFEYLEELYLNMSHISGGIPDEISNLKNLRRLYLPDGSDKKEPKYTIPKGIYSLKHLYEITIQSNRVTFAITDEISELTELEKMRVRLSPNSIVSPNIKNCTKLRDLSLSGDGSQTIPEEVFQCKELTSLYLYDLRGSISESIGELQKLKFFGIRGPNIIGFIPETVGNLHDLAQFSITNTRISGSIPKGLFTAFSTEPNIDGTNSRSYILDLSNNNLSGGISAEFVQFMEKCDFFNINLGHNKLSGDIPIEIQKHPKWCRVWPHIVLTNNFDVKKMYLPGPELSGGDIYGNPIDSETEYAKYDYTILWQIRPDFAITYNYTFNWFYMKELYEKYKAHNIQVLYLGSEWNSEDELIEFKESYDVPFRVFSTNRNSSRHLVINNGECTNYLPTILADGDIRGNQVNIIDKQGEVVFMSEFDGAERGLELFLAKKMDCAGSELYESTDYAEDGKVGMLQKATVGNGIDIVLMGDAYSDRLIADGTYERDMAAMADAFFSVEPYKSFRDYFNVSYVVAVSENEIYDKYSSTVLGGWLSDGVQVGGNDARCFSYGLNVLSADKMDDALIIVAMNSDNYAGTCYMYQPESSTGTYGSGTSIAYFPKGGDAETFAQLLHHEACGHGFAKLADEYAYEEMGTIPSDYASQIQEQQVGWGWWKNVDFTSNPTSVRWSRFLSDDRYQYDGLGVYEGGLTYWDGVWRPTENSIMRYNTGGFNAPSREAIYYRIHKLAYGDSWKYDYEEFVEWDAKNRMKETDVLHAPYRRGMDPNFVPLHPPVMKNKTWRDVLE